MPPKHSNKGSKAKGKHPPANKNPDHTNPPIPPAGAELEMPPPDPDPHKPEEREKHWLDYASFGVEVLGLIGLLIYCVYTAGIYCANKKAAEAAKSAAETASATLQLDQRAWLGLDETGGNPPTEGSVFDVLLKFKNTGHTPAKNIVVYCTMHWVVPVDFKQLGEPVKLGAIFPDATRNFTFHVSKRQPLTKAVAEDGKTRTFTVHGLVTYQDIFSMDHWFSYCLRLDGKDWVYCDSHNDVGNGKPPEQ